jgi:hypothetical protein
VTVLDDTAIDIADGIYEGAIDWQGMVRSPAGAITAAAIPVKPPAHWFQNPNYGKLEPLTVTADGRVQGHIASWREDHIGMAGRVKAPHSKSGYAFFATGALETAEGTMVNVGQITLTGGHAPLEASVSEAVRHYDDTQSAFCDVAVGEDRYGIWVAGALRPTIDDNQLRAIRASSVSGDWRPINGSLEMVAVCAVNVPGFPIPRARVASGVPIALVAAGTGELVDLMLNSGDGVADQIAQSFDDRLRLVESVVLAGVGDTRESLTAAVDEARLTMVPAVSEAPPAKPAPVAVVDETVESPEDRIAALRAKVHGAATGESAAQAMPAEPPVAQVPASTSVAPDALAADAKREALRASVHGPATWVDGMDFHLTTAECNQAAMLASLRARAHPEDQALVARATRSWTSDARETASKKGQALPDGSFPIADKADLAKAIKAVGRASDPEKAKRHIRKRAKTLGAESALPDSW